MSTLFRNELVEVVREHTFTGCESEDSDAVYAVEEMCKRIISSVNLMTMPRQENSEFRRGVNFALKLVVELFQEDEKHSDALPTRNAGQV